MKNLKSQIQKVLKEYPDTRNSDITLMLKIWEEFYGVREIIKTKRIYDLPTQEAIKRIRAKFCEEGYNWAVPTEKKIAEARKISENRWREAMGYKQINPTFTERHLIEREIMERQNTLM